MLSTLARFLRSYSATAFAADRDVEYSILGTQQARSLEMTPPHQCPSLKENVEDDEQSQ